MNNAYLNKATAEARELYTAAEPYIKPENITTSNSEHKLNGIALTCNLAAFGIDAYNEPGINEYLKEILLIIRYSRPDLHWISWDIYGTIIRDGKVIGIVFYTSLKAEYKNLTKADVKRSINCVEKWAKGILKDIKDMPPYRQLYHINKILCQRSEYSTEDRFTHHSIIGVIKGKAACEGYAKALCFLADRINVECLLITGTTKQGKLHAWNAILMDDGQWYQTDIVGNADSTDKTRFLLTGEDDILKTHIYDEDTIKLKLRFAKTRYDERRLN